MTDTDLAFRLDHGIAHRGWSARVDLVREEFGIDLTGLDRFGGDPDLVSLGWWQGARLAATASLVPQTLRLVGQDRPGLALQWVTVGTPWRGRGLFRAAMERAIELAEARGALLTLTTETPELYGRFGFLSVAESAFAGPLAPRGGAAHSRRLDPARSEDAALLVDLARRRQPVSDVAAETSPPVHLLMKALDAPEIAFHHLPGLEAVVAIEAEEPGTLTLLDAVAPRIPSLAAIAAALGGGFERARVCFTPDRLGWTPSTIEAEDTGLMVRGDWPLGAAPFMISAMRV